MKVEDFLLPLANIGVAGIVLSWFMYINHSQMEKMRATIDDLNQNIILLTLSLPDISERTEEEARRSLERLTKRRSSK